MTRYASNWWSAELPEGWVVDEDDVSTSFYQPAGVGVLQVSVMRKGSMDVTESELEQFVVEQYGSTASFEPAEVGLLAGLHGSWEEGDTAWRTWLLHSGQLLWLITYSCGLEDIEEELQQVVGIVESIKPEK